jgi:phosphate transport system substrate-binding protein
VNFAVESAPQSRSRINSLFNGLDDQNEVRLAGQMRDDMSAWDRLSTTVRFPTGSATLGRKEINDIERLISYLEAQPNGTRVAVVGFTDSIGPFVNNERLSDRRAAVVADAITSQARGRLQNVTFETRAYSELAPAVCNTDENGRAINRRVEVWLAK